METNIQKWGNSLGVRLPRAIAARKTFTDGKPVRITETETGILIELIPDERPYIDELVAKITTSNRHGEIAWGNEVGNETW